MWYQGSDQPIAGWPGWGPGRVCYAVSHDGFTWKKPKLGLVEYNGDKQNNLVNLDAGLIRVSVILYEPNDQEPGKRFKMAYECDETGNLLAVAYSQDGLTWRQADNNPVGIGLEMGGLTKQNDCYYLNGQLSLGIHANENLLARRMYTCMSYDFENWSKASVLSFQRDGTRGVMRYPDINMGEQVHMGAAVWNRGNVILGLYGQWHGPVNDDRRFVSMDLGLVVSNDALHFREPVSDFKAIRAREEPDGAYPSLVQGQGFENSGDRTLVWYGGWKDGEVRLALWERDRFGYFSVSRQVIEPYFIPGTLNKPDSPHFITCPIELSTVGYRLFINVDGLSSSCCLRIELCDSWLRPLSGYSASECIPIAESGTKQPVYWRNHQRLCSFTSPIRIRVIFDGIRREDARFYALYICRK